jgi:hypothetical protein
MKHQWVAGGTASMTEDQALAWIAHEKDGVLGGGLASVAVTDLFCASCDTHMGDVTGVECSGPRHPSLHPHRWRVVTTAMLTDQEAESLLLDGPEKLDSSLPRAWNIFCVLCGAEFDPEELNCPQRAALGAASPISDEELARLLEGPFEADRYTWEEIEWIGHDSNMALADAGLERSRVKADFEAAEASFYSVSATLPVFYCYTESDANVPVEVSRDEVARDVIAVRVCWTDDVDEVGGTWETVGHISISGRCRAWDPRHHIEEGGLELDLRADDYLCQVFKFEGDRLGMRLVPGSIPGTGAL